MNESLEMQIIRDVFNIPKCFDCTNCGDRLIFGFYDEMIVVKPGVEPYYIRTVLRDHHQTVVEPWRPQ